MINESGQIRSANTMVLTDLGYEEEEIKQKSIFQINPHFNLLGWRRMWNDLAAGKGCEEQSELLNSEGVLYPIRSSVQMIEFRSEKLCCYLIENLLKTNRYKDLLQFAAEIARIGAWEFDLLKQTVLLTNGIQRLIGYAEEEQSLSLPAFLLWAGRAFDHSSIQELLRRARLAIETGTSFSMELPLRQGAGILQLEARTQVSEGITSKLYGVVQDISRIAARSDEMYMSQFTMDNAMEMIFWVRPDQSIVYANQAVCRQLDYSPEELLQLKVHQIVPVMEGDTWKEHWKRLRRQKHIEREAIQRARDGRLLPVVAQNYYLEYKGQEYNCAFVRNMGFNQDTDDLLQLTYHTLNQSSDLILWVNPDRSIIFFNDSALRLLGYDGEELKKLTIDEIYDGYDFFEDWESLKKDGERYLHHAVRRKDGRLLDVDVKISLVPFLDDECACIIYREQSKLRRKERELAQAFIQIEELREKLQEEKTYLRKEVAARYNFNNIITGSERYRQILGQVAQVAATEATVLLLGETGTGKELLAHAIHQLSARKEEALIKVNCAALPKSLIESELFGHEKGAFTGAHQRKLGRFELADQGTIFLDEVGELPLDLQAKLLRVVQEGEFERLGGTETLKVDVRLVAATNRQLEKLVSEGRFREDLYYRLNVFPIHNLPLRERKEDIPLLVRHFVQKYSEREGRSAPNIPQRAIRQLMNYDFPGNVRELENIVERALILSPGNKLNLGVVIDQLEERSSRRSSRFVTFEEMQRRYIIRALDRTNWKVTGKNSASELLGLNGKTLASKMRKLGIRREEFKED